MTEQKAKRNKRIWTVLVIFWIAFIWANSLTPGEGSSMLSGGVLDFMQSIFNAIGIQVQISTLFIRKAAHFMEYFVLGILSYNWLLCYSNESQKKQILYAYIFAILVAAMDESIQYFIPGRAAMVQDVLLDAAGAAVGILCAMFVLRYRANKKRKEKEHN